MQYKALACRILVAREDVLDGNANGGKELVRDDGDRVNASEV